MNQNKENNGGNMRSVREIMAEIEDKYSYIPLLQRNYKWSMECAAELAEDMWYSFRKTPYDTYQLNMITIYNNKKEDSLQILDGQQRLITLKLLLSFLESEKLYLNFYFERDRSIDERSGRRFFILDILKYDDVISGSIVPETVDTERLYNNYTAMLLPLSFRRIMQLYRQGLNVEKAHKNTSGEYFKNKLNAVLKEHIELILGTEENAKELSEKLAFKDEINDIYKKCEAFNGIISGIGSDDKDNISDDEILVSEYANEFQKLWQHKVLDCLKEKELRFAGKEGFVSYILNNVKMLYHETESEPISEFLNINENKTRFVISDYIRAKMISDNPVDVNISDDEKQKNQMMRNEILQLFGSLSEYLYSKKYSDAWELIRTRYYDFEKHMDINRLKVLFCDKYVGTNTEGYVFEEELIRLKYFEWILEALTTEIGCESSNNSSEIWNTYNAVYMLLECKKRYRFFNLFTENDIRSSNKLHEIIAKEKFCFLKEAYRLAKSSDNVWDISYFLESQLCIDKCDVKKSSNLPEINQGKHCDDWCCFDRGEEQDELYKTLNELIELIKKKQEVAK